MMNHETKQRKIWDPTKEGGPRSSSKDLRRAATTIAGGFAWADQPESSAIWLTVFKALNELADLAQKAEEAENAKG